MLPSTLILLFGCALHRFTLPGDPELAAFLAESDHRGALARFEALLAAEGVADVVPPIDLWRQGTDWCDVDRPPFSRPPDDAWSAIVPTLRVLRDRVVPITGPVVVVSGFRTTDYNGAAGGSKGSRHQWFEAVDVVPRRPWRRKALHARLMTLWATDGPALGLGLGLYSKTRFHIDTWKHRRW